jgi:hypothetical protein
MPKNKQNPESPLFIAFNKLNAEEKKIIKENFIKKFEVKSPNTFYLRLRPEAKIKQIEKDFFSIELKNKNLF